MASVCVPSIGWNEQMEKEEEEEDEESMKETYQLLTWRIVRPVSCASCFFWSSDGYGCCNHKQRKKNKSENHSNHNKSTANLFLDIWMYLRIESMPIGLSIEWQVVIKDTPSRNWEWRDVCGPVDDSPSVCRLLFASFFFCVCVCQSSISKRAAGPIRLMS